MKKYKYVLFLIFSFFIIPFACYADDQYYITKEDANLRSSAKVASGNVITSIKRGAVINLISTTKVWGGSCNSGWYNVSYNGNNGYVCSSYVAYGNPANETDEYLRPWTTPKKAIVGGAIYIASAYINKGQNTSYLKKFNVTKTSTYNHQYMANLAAPYSEAKTSYNSYKNNNLLSLPLTFSIPIFNNMPNYTTLPGKQTDTSCQSDITDQNFENVLNNQGFPESYRCKLRILHAKYPNWTFTAFNTGLDFYNSVTAEQAVSSINGGSAYYNTPLEQTESGWYIANRATVEYYLDPRNFLNEERILMFEDLGYKDYYTEETIKPILKGTFMAEYSLLDNQTYSSLFLEAGKTAKMSSVYLASLARQESGTGGSKATSGAEFSYQGTTYKGLYNFYNLGANSSASSPILAGLVWATGGFDITNIATQAIIPETTKVTDSEQTILNLLGATKKSNYIMGLSIGALVQNIKNKLSGYTTSINLNDNDIIKTGANITISKDSEKYDYTMIIAGDVDGDGKMMATDYVKIKNYIMDVNNLNDAESLAADVDKDGKIGANDYVIIKNNIMNR